MRKFIIGCLTAMLLASTPSHAASALQSFEPDSLQRIVAQHKGKPFVLIVWSLDCEYCQASLKTLAQKTDKKITIVTLATDSVSDPATAALVRKRLDKLEIKGQAWAFGDAPAEQLRYALDPGWHGEIPRSYWFRADGDRFAYSGILTSILIDKFSAR